MAAIYHLKLCRAILVGFRRQLKAHGIGKDGYVGMLEASQENSEVVSPLPFFMWTLVTTCLISRLTVV